MPSRKIVTIKFDSDSINAVRVSVCAYRRNPDPPTNVVQREQLRQAKEVAKGRVLESVEAKLEPALGPKTWVAILTLPNNLQTNANRGGIFRVLLRAEGLEVTRDSTGKVIGTRTHAVVTRPPIRLPGLDS